MNIIPLNASYIVGDTSFTILTDSTSSYLVISRYSRGRWKEVSKEIIDADLKLKIKMLSNDVTRIVRN